MFWFLCAITAPDAVAPQAARPQDDAPVLVESIEITARRGAAAVPPEREFGTAEIDALGAGDIGQAVDRLNSRLGGRSPPVVIVNGQRVPDAQTFLGLPPDALARIEALPSSAAALYGGGPDRKIINIVLQKSFRGRDGAYSAETSTAGGATRGSAGLNLSSLANMDLRRASFNVTADEALSAGDRPDYVIEHPGSEASTLRPQARRFSTNLSSTGALGTWRGSLNLSARAQDSRFVSSLGGQAVVSRNESRNLALTTGLGRQIDAWSLNGGLGAQVSTTQASGLSSARSRTRGLNLSLSASRPLMTLPAGPVTADLSASALRSRVSTFRPSISQRLSSASDEANLALYIPLWDTAAGADSQTGGWLGRAALNLGGGARRANAGQGDNLNASVQWSPNTSLNLNAGWSRDVAVPMEETRLSPTLYGAPTVVFDFRTGESVEVLTLNGGNPDARATRTDAKSLSLSTGPFTAWSLRGDLSYRTSRTTNGMGALPPLTLDIEAAFPERFQRDADGRLISIDQRAVNLASTDSQTLGASLNFSLPQDDAARLRGDTMQVWLNHSVRLGDTTQIRAGLPLLDRLAGDGGGAPRQQFNLQIDGRRGSWGFNAMANWQSAYRVRSQSGRDGDGDLKIGAFGTINVRLSHDHKTPLPDTAGPTARRNRGLTFTLGIDNLLDTRPTARLGDGRAAPGYGRDERDPVGRTARLSLNSRF